MSNASQLIARLAAEGVTPELLGDVAMALAKADAAAEAIAKRRAADRERQEKRRNHVKSRDVTGQTVTTRDETDGPGAPAPCPPHTPPITPTPTTPSDPDGSAVPSTSTEPDPRRDLFGRGKATVARLTGRAPPSCGSLIGRWLKLADDSAVIVLAAIDDAAEADLANPVPWIEAAIRKEAQRNGSGSHDLFARPAPGGGRAGANQSVVAAALARRENRGGFGPGGWEDGSGPEDGRDRPAGRDDPNIEDADWSPTPRYSAAH